MVLGEASADDLSRAAAAYHHLSHLEPGLVIKPPNPAAPAPVPAPPPQPSPDVEPLPPPAPTGVGPSTDVAPQRPAEATERSAEADAERSLGADAEETEHFVALGPQSSGTFEPFDRRHSRPAEADGPAFEPEGAGDAKPPIPSAAAVVRSPTPPQIEAPDPAAAMADAFSAERSSAAVAAQRARAARGIRAAVAVAVVLAVGLGAWVASSKTLRRRIGNVVRLAIIGRKPGGTLIVESIPSGAKVILNGEETGQTTPLTMENLESEITHELTLRLDEGVVRTSTISIVANRKRKLRVVFPEAVATVRVETVPPTSCGKDRHTQPSVKKVAFVSCSSKRSRMR